MAFIQGVAQLGRAPHLGCGCRRFESCHPDSMKAKLQNRINDYVNQLREDTINKKLTWRPVSWVHLTTNSQCKGTVLEATTSEGRKVFLYETTDNTFTLEILRTTSFIAGPTYSSFSVTGTEVNNLYLDIIMPIPSSTERKIAPITEAPSKLQLAIGALIVLGWFAFLIFIIHSRV